MAFRQDLGIRIKTYRRLRGMTQGKLCSRAGLTQSHLSQIERGKFGMTLETLEGICQALRVQPEELFIGIKVDF